MRAASDWLERLFLSASIMSSFSRSTSEGIVVLEYKQGPHCKIRHRAAVLFRPFGQKRSGEDFDVALAVDQVWHL